MKQFCLAAVLAGSAWLAQAGVMTTSDPAVALAYQQGKTVETFDNLNGRTPLTLTGANSGVAVPEAARVFDQVAGVRFSVGGMVGVDRPALYHFDPESGIEAAAVDAVLGGVDFEGHSLFANNEMMELYFPTKVGSFGFWTDPALSAVRVILLSTNFAFSGEEEMVLATYDIQPGLFVGIDRDLADIGGVKLLAMGPRGFTIDDLTFTAADPGTVPEPASALLLLPAFGAGLWLRRRTGRRH